MNILVITGVEVEISKEAKRVNNPLVFEAVAGEVLLNKSDHESSRFC